MSLPAPPDRVSSPPPPDRVSLPLPPHSRSLPSWPLSVSSPFWPKIRSVPATPVSLSLPLPPTVTVTSTVPLFCPSLTVTVRTAVPLRPSTAFTVIVRAARLPANTTLPVGTSNGLEDATLSVSTPAGLSTSATARLTVPEWSLVPHVPPAATVTVGVSLTAVTVSVTVARFEVRVPSLAR
jgi:hypothetical protein